MRCDIGLSEATTTESVRMLNVVLSDEFVLYIKTLNFHWNVVSPDFSEYHLFLEKQYEALLDIVDEVAERARSLGGVAFGSCAEFVKVARLKEHAGPVLTGTHMMEALCKDHEALIRHLRADIEACEKLKDAGTTNFLTDLMERHEKMAWMLRSFCP